MTEILDALQQPHTQLLLRLVLGGILLLAGLAKLRDRAAFRGAVAEYEAMPRPLERPFALILPWVELTAGALLLVGLATPAAAALATALFLSFAYAIGINLWRGRKFDCHCFGTAQRDEIGGPALVRSLALALAALVVATGASRFGALEAALFGSSTDLPPASELLPVVFIAFVIFDVLILLPEALATHASFLARSRPGHAHAHGRRV